MSNTINIQAITSLDGGHRLSCKIDTEDGAIETYFSSADTTLQPNPEALVALNYPRCMLRREDICSEQALDPVFCKGLEGIYQFFNKWDDSYYRPILTQPEAGDDTTTPAGRNVGCFFSGGLDSLYTFLSKRDEITHLIFVHGFDIQLDNQQLRQQTSEAIRYVADQFGKQVIELETDLRAQLYSKVVDWGTEGHGAALACIGHLLSPGFNKIYIPASYTDADDFKWGTHKDLDHFWSSSTLEFIHHGTVERPEKAALIAQHDNIMKTVRVCWMNAEGSYNCGKCEKCIRTMINFMAVGALDKCDSFEEKISSQDIRKQLAGSRKSRVFFESNLAALNKYNSENHQAKAALEHVLNRSPLAEKSLAYWYKRKKKFMRLLGLSKRTHR